MRLHLVVGGLVPGFVALLFVCLCLLIGVFVAFGAYGFTLVVLVI